MDKKTELEISSLEYQIRKIERGIKVLFAQKGNADEILKYGEKREKLQDELEFLTGEREPRIPNWPL